MEVRSEGDQGQVSDEDLVLRVLDDPDEYVHLMNRYEERLLRFIRRITNVPNEDAEDILQEVFIKAYENLRGFDSSLKFSSWIYRITHNQVISHHRKRQARPQVSASIDDEVLSNTLASDMATDTAAKEHFDQKHIEEALKSIDQKYREVIVLKYIEDKSYDEISAILKKPVGTVGTLINRAKKHLYHAIKEKGAK